MVVQKLPKLSQFNQFNWQGFFALCLLVLVFISLISIILIQHQVRHLETQYANALKQEVILNEEHGKLTLEKHHLTALARVEHIARTQLNMTLDKTPENLNSQTIILEKLDAPSAESEN